MNIDDLARRAARDLRESVHATAEPHGVVRVAERRRRAHEALLIGAIALVMFALPLVVHWLDSGRAAPGPILEPTETPSPTAAALDPAPECATMRVTCVGDRTYKVWLEAPITWTLPEGFEAPYSRAPGTRDLVETMSDGGASGMVVAQGADAAQQDGSGAVPGVLTAEQLVEWIAERPFLASSAVEETTVDGRRAWTVETEVAPGAGPGPMTCAGAACYPLIAMRGEREHRSLGLLPGRSSRFTALDAHPSGIVVLWSWARDDAARQEVDRVADGVQVE